MGNWKASQSSATIVHHPSQELLAPRYAFLLVCDAGDLAATPPLHRWLHFAHSNQAKRQFEWDNKRQPDDCILCMRCIMQDPLGLPYSNQA